MEGVVQLFHIYGCVAGVAHLVLSAVHYEVCGTSVGTDLAVVVVAHQHQLYVILLHEVEQFVGLLYGEGGVNLVVVVVQEQVGMGEDDAVAVVLAVVVLQRLLQPASLGATEGLASAVQTDEYIGSIGRTDLYDIRGGAVVVAVLVPLPEV